MPVSKFAAVEANATNRPSSEIDDSVLAPSAAVAPASGVEIRLVVCVQLVTPKHSDCQKTSCAPFGFGALGPRFVALEVKDTNVPLLAIDGCVLASFPVVTPSAEDTR